MAIGSLLDHSVGMALETTFATSATPTRFNEWTPGNGIDFDPKVSETQGIRQGSHFDRQGRRVPVIGQGSGSIQMDILSKGMGLWWQWAMGTGASALVSGSTQQQLFTTVLPGGTTLKSATIQEGIVQATAGQIDAYTYLGCTCKGFEIACSSSSPLASVKFDVDAKALATGTAYATPSYASAPLTVFNFGALTATIGGTLTEPTTTVLGSAATPTTLNVRGVTITVDNAIDDGRWVPGSRNQPTVGDRMATIKMDVEYDAFTGTQLRDAYIAQTSIGPGIFTWTGNTITGGVETLQTVAPALLINSGAIPIPSDDKTIITSIECKVMDNLTASQPLWIVARTLDAAL